MADPLYTIQMVSENSLLVQYHEEFSTHLSVYIARCGAAVTDHFQDEILNTIPSYNGLLITFKPYVEGDFLDGVKNVLENVAHDANVDQREVITIPAYYDHEVAPFLDEILADSGYTLQELIKAHTAQPFFVYMIGFCPGFGYMGELPKQMHLPRRNVPQLKIAAGSVAIADFQTSIYPIEMPGGWHIIGRTPLQVFNAGREQPSLFQQGDRVQFTAISRDEFIAAGGVL